MADDKRTFDFGGSEYAVRVPKVDEIKGANEIRAKTFNESLTRGDLLRDQLEGELRKRKLWNDDREQEYQTLRQEVLNGEFKLQKGGIKLSEAKSVAVEMSDNRNQMVDLLSSRTDLDANTCEGKADAARFNYLFASCLVYNETGDPYFPNGLDDYLENQNDSVAIIGATQFYYLISGTENADETLPENQFLKKFKFIDDKLRLIDDNGRLINDEGHHIDEYGNLIQWNPDGTSNKVDELGRIVNQAGDFDVEHSAFLDDKGKAIDESKFDSSQDENVEEDAFSDETVTETHDKKASGMVKTAKKKTTKKTAKKKVETDN